MTFRLQYLLYTLYDQNVLTPQVYNFEFFMRMNSALESVAGTPLKKTLLDSIKVKDRIYTLLKKVQKLEKSFYKYSGFRARSMNSLDDDE